MDMMKPSGKEKKITLKEMMEDDFEFNDYQGTSKINDEFLEGVYDALFETSLDTMELDDIMDKVKNNIDFYLDKFNVISETSAYDKGYLLGKEEASNLI